MVVVLVDGMARGDLLADFQRRRVGIPRAIIRPRGHDGRQMAIDYLMTTNWLRLLPAASVFAIDNWVDVGPVNSRSVVQTGATPLVIIIVVVVVIVVVIVGRCGHRNPIPPRCIVRKRFPWSRTSRAAEVAARRLRTL